MEERGKEGGEEGKEEGREAGRKEQFSLRFIRTTCFSLARPQLPEAYPLDWEVLEPDGIWDPFPFCHSMMLHNKIRPRVFIKISLYLIYKIFLTDI